MARGKHRAPSSRLKWWFLLFGCLLLGGGWYAGSQLYSRQRQIDQLMIGIKNNQNKVIMQKLTSTAGVKVNAQSVRPLLSYYQQHPQQLTRLQRDLEQHGSSTAGFF